MNAYQYVRKAIQPIFYRLPRKVARGLMYLKKHHKMMNWKNPLTYDEKINYLIATKYDESYAKYADKYEMRDYVKKCGLENLLVPLLGVYNKAEEIRFSELPEKFILKATHGSGDSFYEICDKRKGYDEKKIREKFSCALKVDLSHEGCEYHYAGIKPRIICEQLLEVETDKRMTDYKVVCTWGTPVAILVCYERNKGRDYYSTDWQYLPSYTKPEFHSGRTEEKPECLEELLRAAAVLSMPFPLVRIDFYIAGGCLYVGEITLTPSCGYHDYLTTEGNLRLGEKIQISK